MILISRRARSTAECTRSSFRWETGIADLITGGVHRNASVSLTPSGRNTMATWSAKCKKHTGSYHVIHQQRLRWKRLSLCLLFASALPVATVGQEQDATVLHFFAQDGCPACERMSLFLIELSRDLPSLDIRTNEITGHMGRENRRTLLRAAQTFETKRLSVPAIFLGDRIWTGHDDTIVDQIRREAERCLEEGCIDALAALAEPDADVQYLEMAPREATVTAAEVPSLFGLSGEQLPIIVSTALIAFLDGLNPCSLWVLTFLLAMVIHTGSRHRVLLVGSVFLLVTALIYGLFIAGVVSAIAVIARLSSIRIMVVVLALAIGAINIKDFFAFRQGVSLTLSDQRRNSIAKRFVHLGRRDGNLLILILSTAGLAAGIAVIELPCTAGFPVAWANLVASAEIPSAVFWMLLTLYVLIYLLIEVVLVLGTAVTFRRILVTERSGRLLKLFGGTLMVSLALVMLVRPQLMESLVSTGIVFAAAGTLGLVLLVLDRGLRSSADPSNDHSRKR